MADVWLTPAEVRAQHGVPPTTLRDWYSRGEVQRRPGRAGHVYLESDVVRAMGERYGARGSRATNDDEHDDDRPRVGASMTDPAYEYFPERDVYVFSLDSRRGVLTIPGDTIRAAVRAYSNATDSKPETLNGLARKFSWTRQEAREILRALGKTHDSAPFSDEEIAERDEDDLAEELVRAKEGRVLRKAQRERWQQIEKLAEKAERWEKFVGDRLLEVAKAAPPPQRPPRVRLKGVGDCDPYDVFCYETDLHYGKYGAALETGEDYNRVICRERLMDSLSTITTEVMRRGAPSRWVTGVGGDGMQVDNGSHTTTRGTPQDVDGNYAEILYGYLNLQAEKVQYMRQTAPVLVVVTPGNHDWHASLAAAKYLEAYYRDAPDVEVICSPKPRHYVRLPNVLACVTHGNHAKWKDLPMLMAVEAKRDWGEVDYRYVYTGHLHHERIEHAGATLNQMPSLAGHDRFHSFEGYVTSKAALKAYCLDHQRGEVATFTVAHG